MNDVFVIKKIATARLTKENGFKVDLNLLGLGLWEKGSVDVFSSVEKMKLTSYCRGYDINIEDVGVTSPIFKATLKKIANNKSKKTNSTSGHPSSTNFKLMDNTFMASVVVSGQASRGDRLNVFAKKNSQVLFDNRSGIGTPISGGAIIFKDVDEEVIVNGGWYGGVMVEKPFKFEVVEFFMDEKIDEDCVIFCIFIHR